ncbi:MAG: acyl-[acyl-carrier-protein] desaturase [Verrucomicrobiales bacterium]|jgi:acyl-[acyl-carrier-protein] desaturase
MTNRLELMAAVEGNVEALMADHLAKRPTWYAHDLIKWEDGRNYVDEPWDESQCTISPEVREALVLNLLTEDNLPYYHYAIASQFGEDSAIGRWTRRWTAEEGQHAIVIRDYLMISRNCDPIALEDDRVATISKGWDSPWTDPIDIFVYTSAQELATRVSHRNTGVKADDEVAYEIMKRVAADENYHYIFYKGIVTAMLEHDPSACIQSMRKVYENFNMPGTVVPKFRRRAALAARAEIYDLRIHAEKVIAPVLREWKIDTIEGLTPEADEDREAVIAMPGMLVERAERLEARAAKAR